MYAEMRFARGVEGIGKCAGVSGRGEEVFCEYYQHDDYGRLVQDPSQHIQFFCPLGRQLRIDNRCSAAHGRRQGEDED